VSNDDDDDDDIYVLHKKKYIISSPICIQDIAHTIILPFQADDETSINRLSRKNLMIT
jgi:hypothetical protein